MDKCLHLDLKLWKKLINFCSSQIFCHNFFFILFNFLDQVAWVDGEDLLFSIGTFCPPCFLATASRLNPYILPSKDITTNIKGFFVTSAVFLELNVWKWLCLNDYPGKWVWDFRNTSALYLLTPCSWTMGVTVPNCTRGDEYRYNLVVLKTQGNDRYSGVKRLYNDAASITLA